MALLGLPGAFPQGPLPVTAAVAAGTSNDPADLTAGASAIGWAAAPPAVQGPALAAAPTQPSTQAPTQAPSQAPEPTPSATPTVPPAPAALTPELSAALTKRLGQLRAQYGMPGIQAAIIFPDGRSWRGHAGFQDYGARVAVQNQTPFPIASVTKTFIAALVVQLAQEGRFGLDDPLVTYLPAAAVDARVTIRELLDHSSGVADFFANSKIDTAILGCRSCAWTPARSLSYVKKALFAPGTKWAYSNTNYVLLGQLAEAVTGQTYAALLRERFIEPLGLISTFVQGQEPRPWPVAHSYRFFTASVREKPTPLWDGTGVSPFRSLATAAGSAGDMASSARDLALWVRALYGGRVLGAEGSAAMLDFGGSMLLRSSIPYGLGVEQFTVAGRLAYGHGGRLMGARSAVRYLPEENLSIAVVVNTDRGDPAAIVEALAAVILPPLPAPSPSPTPGPAGPAPQPASAFLQ
jgi:D-alanyl-D-alanine carboxypeptidase